MDLFFLGLDCRFHTVRVFCCTGLEYDIAGLVGVFHRIIELYARIRFKDSVIGNRRFSKYRRKSGDKIRILPVIDRAPAPE